MTRRGSQTAGRGFGRAAARVTSARRSLDALPACSTIHEEIAAGEALARARAVLEMVRAPSHEAFARKLRLMLEGVGVDQRLIGYLEADVRSLTPSAENSCWAPIVKPVYRE